VRRPPSKSLDPIPVSMQSRPSSGAKGQERWGAPLRHDPDGAFERDRFRLGKVKAGAGAWIPLSVVASTAHRFME